MTDPPMHDIEDALIDHVMYTTYDDLPRDIVSDCKRLVMDTLGVSFPGSLAPGCPEMAALLAGWPCTGGNTLLFSGVKISPPQAAMANSTFMHALDFDDTLDTSALHTFVTVLPAAFAAAEIAGGISGRRFITALVLGVDVICRISFAIRTPLSWIRTATCGGFGAAVAAGKILGLNRDALADALGVVYSQISGNAQGLLEGKLVKRMQPGFAASAGVTAVLLARAGITGSRGFLTGAYGYFNLYEKGIADTHPVLDNIGKHYCIGDLSIKPYPCCRMTHSAIDTALSLREPCKDRLEEIERIDVKVSKMVTEMVGKPFVPGTDPQVDAQFNIPYTVGCALVRGDVFLGDFETEAIHDPRVQALAGRVYVSEDDHLPDRDLFHSAITVRMKSGEVFNAANAVPLGNPQKAMDNRKCREKFIKCVDYSRLSVDRNRCDTILSIIENLEETSDVRRLIELMILP